MAFETLHDVLVDHLKDLLNAEKQIVRALPKLVRAASNDKLRRALEEHLEVTRGQVKRLEQVFSSIEEPAKGKKCAGMKGLIAEGDEVLGHKKESSEAALDAAIIVAAQKVEHYEISAYGSACAFAEELGYQKAAGLLQETLDEESEANETLDELAKEINAAAAAGSEDEEVEEEQAVVVPSARNGRSRNGRHRSR